VETTSRTKDAIMFKSVSWVEGAVEWLSYTYEGNGKEKINDWMDFPAT